ncbi:MAG TPA: MFS transporter [Baekduia sp.]|uniref:MFS transporter n=1 Tax=Baekduia sp. TaxID=2600305 RepID=UPI002D7756A2|nr:MFS transporter [Baekduia sp.]HET6510419.1 MFS transporter [Baekduia sp.]
MTSPLPSSATRQVVGGDRWTARTWAALMLLCGVLFLDGLDVSMVGVALPSIREDLSLSTAQLQWVVSGYVLGYGGLLLLGGRAADLLGRRRVLIVGMSVFAVASLLGGLVDDPTLLIATRFLKGASAAFTAPAGLSYITTTFQEGPARNKALSVYSAFGASGFSSGLILGGLLTEAGWRFTFLLPVPFALLILALAPRLLAKDAPSEGPRPGFDLPGALAITASMLLLVRTVVRAPDVGWASAETLVAVAVVAALLTAFVTIERRAQHPLVRLGILRSGHIVRANLGAMATAGSYFGFQFIATLYFQTVLGWSALETALAFLPAGLLVAFGSTRVGPLVDRVGTQSLIAVAFIAFAAGYALFLRADLDPTYITMILPTMVLIGTGFALGFPSFNMQGTTGVADHEQGVASGLINTSFQVGGAVTLAVVSAVIGDANAGGQAFLNDSHTAIGVVTGVAALGLISALSGLVVRRRSTARAAEALGA